MTNTNMNNGGIIMRFLPSTVKTATTALALLSIIGLAGCGANNANTAQPTTSPSSTSGSPSPSSTTTVNTQAQAYLYLTVAGGVLKKGSDGKFHDTFLPGNFTLQKGVPTQIEIANFDEGPHTITAPGLGINIQIPGHKADGIASITKVTVTATKSGTFDWNCTLPCDAKAGGWAMGQDGFMRGKISVLDDSKQYVDMTIAGGVLEKGSDGRYHDAFLPANITVNKGEPVVLTFSNFDEGPHTFTVPGLNLNVQIPGHKADGVASVTTVQFTPSTAGTYKWNCLLPCDAKAGGWAMSQPGFMEGVVTVQ